MIEKLTEEQERELIKYREEWLKVGLATGSTDRETTEKVITAFYQKLGKPKPEFIWAKSPLEAQKLINDKEPGEEPSYHHTYQWGSLDSYWIAFYLYIRDVLKVPYSEEDSKMLDLWADLARGSFWWWPYEEYCFVSDRPEEIHKDGQGRLHNPNGPSLKFSDGWKLYHVGGVEMPGDVIDDHSKITVAMIEGELNAERRRVLIDLYGVDRYVRDSGATKVQEDEKGTLWRKEVRDDVTIMMVEVVNSHPEGDGTYKHYWLRVPDTMETAKQAVAWTFEFDNPDDYNPIFES